MNGDNIVTKRRLAIQQAMTLTERTIQARLSAYRCLVISVALIGFISFVWSVVQWAWLPLVGFLLFLPLTGSSLCVDGILLNRWRLQLLKMWIDEQVDLDSFCETLCTINVPAKEMLQGMLLPLPTRKSLQITEHIIPLVRRALAATVQVINACQSDRTLFATIAFTMGLVSLALAVVLPSWLPLLGLLLVVPVLGVGVGINSLRLWRWKWKVLALQQEELPLKSFVELAARLDWNPIPAKRKARFLGALMDRARAT
jgi:hypothetical protein